MKFLVLNNGQIALHEPKKILTLKGDKGDASTIPGPKGDPGKDSYVPGPKGDPGKDSYIAGPKGDPGKDSTVPGPKGDPGKDSYVAGPKGDPGKDSTVPGPKGDKGDPGLNPSFPDGTTNGEIWTWYEGKAQWRDLPALGGIGYRTRFNLIDARLTALEGGIVVNSTFYPHLDFSYALDSQLLMVI